MKREYSKILKGLLEKWDDASTMHFIDCKGISSRNWRIQCLEAGVVDGHKWKQREIAQEYNMTVARISKILESVRVRLSDSVEENCRIGLIREYRARLHRFLRENPVLNATFGAVLRDVGKTPYILPSGAVGVGKYADDKYCYYLIANGKNLRCESASYFKLATGKKHECQSCGYVVFWLKEDIEKIGSSKSVFFDTKAVRSAKWLFFYDDIFWVIDKIGKDQKKKLITVQLKPAEHGSSVIKE